MKLSWYEISLDTVKPLLLLFEGVGGGGDVRFVFTSWLSAQQVYHLMHKQ